MSFKKICFLLIAAFIVFISIKALIQSNGETAEYFQENMVVVEDGKYHEENNGKVVAIKGRLSTDEYVEDDRFGVWAENTPRLERKVLEYRLFDSKKNYSYDTDNTSEKTRYNKRWEDKSTVKEYIANDKYQLMELAREITKDDSVIDVNSETFTVNPKLNGEFEIPEEKLKKFPSNRPVIIDTEDDSPDKEYQIDNYNYSFIVKNNEYTTVIDNKTYLGDIRVSFKCLDLDKLGTVTVVAKQEDGKLVEYEGENMDIVFEVYKGDLSRDEIIAKLKEDDSYAILGVVITLVVLVIIGIVVFRDNIADYMEKKNIQIKISENLLQSLVFIAFLIFLIVAIIITVRIVKQTLRAQNAIPVEATVVAYRDEYHGSEIGYYYTYEYVVNDELFQKEYNNVSDIPFDLDEETEDGSIAKFEAYYDKDNPSVSYIAKERKHNIMFYIVQAFFIALFTIGMCKSISNIKNNKQNKKTAA